MAHYNVIITSDKKRVLASDVFGRRNPGQRQADAAGNPEVLPGRKFFLNQ